jgi:F0F1-type ATP synthase assembly protein I
MVLLVAMVIISMQVFLSMRSNKHYGLIIPGINIICFVVIAFLFTDIAVAILWFLFCVIQIGIWLGIYAVCRRKIAAKAQSTMQRMKIADL